MTYICAWATTTACQQRNQSSNQSVFIDMAAAQSSEYFNNEKLQHFLRKPWEMVKQVRRAIPTLWTYFLKINFMQKILHASFIVPISKAIPIMSHVVSLNPN